VVLQKETPMAHPFFSKKRSQTISAALFCFGLAVLAYLDAWWPGILLAVGIPLAIRQGCQNRLYDALVSILVFGGVFATVQFDVGWKVLLPVLLTIAGIHILFRDYLQESSPPVDEEEEDLNVEMEEREGPPHR
jgi:hypothetical protein